MRRSREAIDATMFAAAIGIDRAVERDVRRFVAGDDLAGRVDRDRRLERRQFLDRAPAVVEGDARDRLITAGGIRVGPATAPAAAIDPCAQKIPRRRRGGWRQRRTKEGSGTSHERYIVRDLEQNKNIPPFRVRAVVWSRADPGGPHHRRIKLLKDSFG